MIEEGALAHVGGVCGPSEQPTGAIATAPAPACPGCGAALEDAALLFEFGYAVGGRSLPVALRRCKVCRFLYLSPRPNETALRMRCATAYNRPSSSLVADRRGAMMARLLGTLEREDPRPRSLLDVGCASGQLLCLARERGWAVAGVEADTQGAAYARDRGLRVECRTSLSECHFPPASFGAIVMVDSLYYFPDPAEELEQASQLLTPSGVVLIRLPSRQWIVSALCAVATLMPSLRPRLGRIVFRCISDGLWSCHLPTLEGMLAHTGFTRVRTTLAEWAGGGPSAVAHLVRCFNGFAALLRLATLGKCRVSTGVVVVARKGPPV